MFHFVVICILSYALGSLPSAYIVGNLLKVDLNQVGSRNIGASNLAFHCGVLWALPIIIFDIILKGSLPVWFAVKVLGLEYNSWLIALPAFTAILGHNWSCFLKFKGGRGILVIIGILIITAPLILLFSSVTFILGWILFRNTAIWTLFALCSTLIWSLMLPYPSSILIPIGSIILIVLKRLVPNLDPLPSHISKKRLYFNRLLHDRDISDRKFWISRVST